MSTWQYTVKQVWDESAGAAVDRDISSNVIRIENLTDTGSGEINSGTVVLNGNKGQFITQDNSNTTPILTEFDKLEITITDKNSDVFRKVLEISALDIRKTISEGVRIVVRLIGQERALADVQFAKPFFYEDAFDVVKDIVDQYNDIKGSRQVTILNNNVVSDSGTYYNNLPQWNYNNWEFGNNETACMVGITQVLDTMGNSVSGGGASDFFECRFYDRDSVGATTYYNNMYFQAFASGEQPVLDGGTITTLENTIVKPHYQSTGEIERRTGTVVCAKGAQGFGSLPSKTSKWWSTFEAFLIGVPDWDSTYPYKEDNIVNNDPPDPTIKWRALRDNTNVIPNTTNTSDWEQIQIGDLITDTNYSPWTNNGSTDGYKMWEASVARPNYSAGTYWDNIAAMDCNVYVADNEQFQEWADTRVYTDATGSQTLGSGVISTSLCYAANPSENPKIYRGFKVLVDSSMGTLAGSFAQNSGKDRHGKSYDKAVVIYRGEKYTGSESYKNWDVKLNPSEDDICAVINEADNYRFFNSGSYTNTWRSYWQGGSPWKDDAVVSIRWAGGGNHCFHPISDLYQSEGVNTTYTRTGSSTSTAGSKYGTNSAVTFEYDFSKGSGITGLRNSADYYRHGAWATLRFPFPTTRQNSQTVGGKYGNNTIKHEPVTVDINNMHLTPSGNVGFNNSEAEELGQISGIGFWIKLRYGFGSTGSTLKGWQANFKMRCACYDTSGNVAVQDFVIGRNDVFEQVNLDIRGFKIYRARTFYTGNDDVMADMFPPELEVLEIFDWKNLKMMTWQTQDSYDEQGRYRPELFTKFGQQFPIIDFTAAQVRLTIDNLHFRKQLIATSGVDTTRNITPEWLLRPFTVSYYQLKRDVESQKEIEDFQYQAYTITTEGVCDPNLKFGYSFYLKDDKIVNRADKGETSAGDNDGEANTIKLVAKKIEYSIDGTTGGQGGFTRTILGVKRFDS